MRHYIFLQGSSEVRTQNLQGESAGQVALLLLFNNRIFLAPACFGPTTVINVLHSIDLLNIETILSAHSKRDNFIKGSSEVLIKERVDSGINQTVKIS